MFQTFFPQEVSSSTYQIDFQRYYNAGYRGILFDIDNTLVPHDADASEQAIQLFSKLRRMGFDTCLLSNNKEPRVQRFNERIQSHYVYKAGKPMRRGYEQAMQQLGTTPKNTLFVGDQLFTDVWGAKRIGIHCILVSPINPKEEIQIVLKRYLEKIVLHFYRRRQNVILIGFMGSGKSTVGRRLAEKTGRSFLDTDAYLVAREGMTIPELFAQKGEDYFRKQETAVLEELLQNTHNTVIATGGGLPLRKKNAELLRRLGAVVYLRADEDTIYERVKDATDRPLLCVDDPRQRIQELLLEREPLYVKASDTSVETDSRTVEQVVRCIQKQVRRTKGK